MPAGVEFKWRVISTDGLFRSRHQLEIRRQDRRREIDRLEHVGKCDVAQHRSMTEQGISGNDSHFVATRFLTQTSRAGHAAVGWTAVMRCDGFGIHAARKLHSRVSRKAHENHESCDEWPEQHDLFLDV